MRLFKKSKTSKVINFNSTKKFKGNVNNKNVNREDQKYEDNIERIVYYIKQNIKENERQKENNKEIDNSKNKIEINNNIFDFPTIKYILNKVTRNMNEILVIKTYLSSMKFLSTLKFPIGNDKLLYSLSLYLKMEKKSKDEIIFRYGNKGTKFFIVLEGEISILILKETKALISFKRYFLHLLLLKMLKEDELVKKTIFANSKMKYHFDDKDFDNYYEKIVNFANRFFGKGKKGINMEKNIDINNVSGDGEDKDGNGGEENENEENDDNDNDNDEYDFFINNKKLNNRTKSISISNENKMNLFKFLSKNKNKKNTDINKKEKNKNIKNNKKLNLKKRNNINNEDNNKDYNNNNNKENIEKEKDNQNENKKNSKEESKDKENITEIENEKEKEKDFSLDNESDKLKIKEHSRLMQKRNTTKFFNPKFILSSLLRKNEQINYNHIDLPYFEIHEVKQVILYYIYLREVIYTKKQNISINDYIEKTYLNSPFHKTLAGEQYSKKELLILFQYFEIAKKTVGESFGELSLQREDNKRTGTCITTSDCILGYLSRADYNTYLGEIEVKKRKNDINFVMSFAIFDNMNKSLFENKYFNFFKRENFTQGEKILIQDQKINKIYFIMEGQFEITTNLSIVKIYSILQHKTKKNIDDRKKLNIKKKNFNMRLYICYNKDILGLEDCCYKDNISFINAKCTSLTGIAFTIEKSILDEIKYKIPEIDDNIKIIIEKRQQVMIDRLINIYNRIAFTNNKDKKNNSYKNKKSNKNESIKYINYLFGINKNQKIDNTVKTMSSTSKKNRIKSALPSKNGKIKLNNINKENITNNNNNNNSSSKREEHSNNISNFYHNSNILDKNSYSSKTVYAYKNYEQNPKEEIKEVKSDIKSKFKDIFSRNSSQSILKLNKIFFSNNKNALSNIINDTNETIMSNININNVINNGIINESDILLKNKLCEIMNNKIRVYKSRDKKLMLKMSKNYNRARINHTRKKFIGLYHPINQIITKEYSNLFNWIDTHQSDNNIIPVKKSIVKNFRNDNKNLLQSKSSTKYYLSKKSIFNQNNKSNTILSSNKNNNMNNKKRPLSSTNSEKKIFLKKSSESNKSKLFLSYDKHDKDISKILLDSKSGVNTPSKKNSSDSKNKKILSSIILGHQNIPQKFDAEKFLKQILGNRYVDHFVSYEEKKLRKLIESYDIIDKFINKGKNNRANMINYKINKSRPMSAIIKFNTKLLKK